MNVVVMLSWTYQQPWRQEVEADLDLMHIYIINFFFFFYFKILFWWFATRIIYNKKYMLKFGTTTIVPLKFWNHHHDDHACFFQPKGSEPTVMDGTTIGTQMLDCTR